MCTLPACLPSLLVDRPVLPPVSFIRYLTKTGAVFPAPKVVHHGLWRGEEIPPPGVHPRRHRNLLSEKGVPQTWVVRHLLSTQEHVRAQVRIAVRVDGEN